MDACSVRQFVTLHILRPMAKALGLKKSKLFRFLERQLPASPLILRRILTKGHRGLRGRLLWHHGYHRSGKSTPASCNEGKTMLT